MIKHLCIFTFTKRAYRQCNKLGKECHTHPPTNRAQCLASSPDCCEDNDYAPRTIQIIAWRCIAPQNRYYSVPRTLNPPTTSHSAGCLSKPTILLGGSIYRQHTTNQRIPLPGQPPTRVKLSTRKFHLRNRDHFYKHFYNEKRGSTT
jgi:hypothetical protein